jgi:hypothetical protein
MTRRLLEHWLASCLLAAYAAMSPQHVSTPRLVDVTMAHGVFDGARVAPGDLFAPEDTPIYVWFRCEGCDIGTVITSSWFYLEPDPPFEFARGSVVVNTMEDFGEFHCALPPGRRWALGSYGIELRVNDETPTELRFRVALNTE